MEKSHLDHKVTLEFWLYTKLEGGGGPKNNDIEIDNVYLGLNSDKIL